MDPEEQRLRRLHWLEQLSTVPQPPLLIAVTKTLPDWESMVPLYLAGQRHFGESRQQLLALKQRAAPPDCHWHFLGPLQSNKIAKIVASGAWIHSVTTPLLATQIAQCATAPVHILLQVNTSTRPSSTLSPEAWLQAWDPLLALPMLQIEGLMTMAPAHATEAEARHCFTTLRTLRTSLASATHQDPASLHLSMGMSRDALWAVTEGSTLVRIGRALVALSKDACAAE